MYLQHLQGSVTRLGQVAGVLPTAANVSGVALGWG
jgi:hypothetical protein